MKKNIVITVIASLFITALVSCASNKVQELPVEMTKLEIVQQAQTAFDAGKADLAIHYYETLLKRYGMETAVYIEGNYEIAHIYIKQKKYDKAYPKLLEIKEIYANAMPGSLPGSYKKLTEIDLAKIPDEIKNK